MSSTEPNLRLPVKREPAPPPALWRQAAPAVARGAALVAAGLVGEWLLRSAARRALSIPFQRDKPPRKSRALARRNASATAPREIAISETVITRRVIFRR
jgi:hypothetical protein